MEYSTNLVIKGQYSVNWLVGRWTVAYKYHVTVIDGTLNT